MVKNIGVGRGNPKVKRNNEIILRAASGESLCDIAEEFDISAQRVGQILDYWLKKSISDEKVNYLSLKNAALEFSEMIKKSILVN